MNSAAQSSNPGDEPSLLAPGFRFHPTDEELVSYYLRRKVLGRPLRVDAIAEVDLYKIEPWDLPVLSRIRSRDLEWYFFSSLDRKYSNRSRTNRATAQGYWKTTGKDRAIFHGEKVVGMKKTLVFHVGRAPKGKRTNWVMHEYRLGDGKHEVQQDVYVVCRIFQKSGSGPQNGAQYGAPFVEEEWDEEGEANGLAIMPIGLENEVNIGEDNGYVQFDEYVQSQEMENQNHGASNVQLAGSSMPIGNSEPAHHAVISEEQLEEQKYITSMPIGNIEPAHHAVISEEQLEEQKYINEMLEFINGTGPENNFPIGTEETENQLSIENGSQSPPNRPDEYLELNDLVNIASVKCPSEESDNYSLMASSSQRWADAEGDDSSSRQLFGNDEFVGGIYENSDESELLQMLPAEDNMHLQPNGIPNTYPCPSWNDGEDEMEFYDVPNEFSFTQEGLFQSNEQIPPFSGPSSLDTIDDFMAYFDATDAMLHHDNSQLENTAYFLDQSKIGNMVKVDDSSSNKKEVSYENFDGASSSAVYKRHDISSDISTKMPRKHLVNILGSLSAPSAFASEFPPKMGKIVGQISATSSPINVTAGVIELHGLAMTGIRNNWSFQKNAEVDFLLSCSLADTTVGKSVYSEPMTKVYGGMISVVLRPGFNLFFVSALILAISCKVGMRIYSW